MDRLTAMETFVSVIEAGSFSGGARRLNVGQPAVSKSIAQLEERLGVRLVMRSTRGLTPTEAGQQYYQRAKRAIEEVDEAELVARGAGAGLSGRLRVSAAPAHLPGRSIRAVARSVPPDSPFRRPIRDRDPARRHAGYRRSAAAPSLSRSRDDGVLLLSRHS